MEIRVGLWKKTAKSGTTYYAGKVTIDNKEYQLTLFKNNKQTEKQPDLNIIMRDSTNSQDSQKVAEKEHKNSESGQIKQQQFTVDDVFEEFGNMIEKQEQEEDEFPF